MLETNSILTKKFQSKLRTHCMFNSIVQMKFAVNNHVRDDPWHTSVT